MDYKMQSTKCPSNDLLDFQKLDALLEKIAHSVSVKRYDIPLKNFHKVLRSKTASCVKTALTKPKTD